MSVHCSFIFIIELSSKSDDKLVHGHMCHLYHDHVGCCFQQMIAGTNRHSGNTAATISVKTGGVVLRPSIARGSMERKKNIFAI